MKKTFTFFAISALFLMLLFPVSVKADTTLSFVYSSTGQDTHCNGSNTYSDKGIKDSDFRWSDNNKDNVKNVDVSGDKWTGVKSDYTACSRNTYSFYGSSCTLNLLINQLWDNVERSLPSITINGNTYYAAQATWGGSNSETIVDNKFNFTDSKNSRNTPVTFVYNNVNPGTGTFDISVYFPSGDADKFLVKTLTITQNAATYDVTATASNGSVSGTGSYAEGASVTLTASPDPDYSFSGWASVSGVDLTGHLNDNPLTFTMPGNAVSLTANFTACTKHTVTLTAGDNGSVSGGGLQCDGSVTVNASPNTGYRFVNWTRGGLQVSTNAEYTFTLSEDVSLTANFEVDPCFASLIVQVEDAYLPNGAVSASKGYPTTMIFKEKQAGGSAYRTGCNGRGFMQVQEEGDRELFIPVNITTAGNYKVKARSGQDKNTYINIYAITGDGETITYNSTTYYKKTYKRINEGQGESFAYSDYTGVVSLPIGVCLIGLYSEYTWAAYDEITITCTDGTAFCPNTITMQKSGDASADDPTSSPANTAMAGTKVTITAGEASANHYFSGWTVSPENAVTFANQTNATTTFVMPAEDVTITANYGAVVLSALTFSAVEGGSITSATAGGNAINSGAEVISGTSVTLTAGANSNYVFINWTDNNNSNAVVSTNAEFTFSMPATATSYTANFAQIDNVISQGSESGSSANIAGGGASITESNISDFDAFAHNVIKLAYSNMSGNDKWYGWNLGKQGSYNSANSAGATGFGFYYKTESTTDAVALWFDPNHGDKDENQHGMQLPATNNVWKYVYFAHADANSWNKSYMRIFINGDKDSKSTAHASGAIYIADIAATSITSKPEINSYTYTRANNSNSYGTLCLPMAGSVSGATLYSIAGKQEEGGKLYIVLEEQGATLAAGEPYIFETDGSTLTATMSGPHSPVNADANGLVGTYQLITAPAYSESTNDLNYVLALDNSNNTVFKRVGENVTIGAYRAYINIKNAVDYSPASAAPGRKYIRFGIEGTEEEQAVEMIYDDASLRTRKIMQNGHLYILRDGHLFTAQGTRIK